MLAKEKREKQAERVVEEIMAHTRNLIKKHEYTHLRSSRNFITNTKRSKMNHIIIKLPRATKQESCKHEGDSSYINTRWPQ